VFLNNKSRKWAAIPVAAALSLVLMGASECEPESTPPAQKAENKARQNNYDRLVKSQPALGMDYSPTRDTKNFWIKTWGTKGKVSYVYLLSNGEPWAFAVVKRLPVSYCVGLVRPVELETKDWDSGGSMVTVPAPSIDGTYASSSNCSTMYAEDATTGAYVEWTVGADTTMLLRDQPLPLNMYADAIPLGDTTASQAAKADDR
jgi:hypothetical protein